MFLLCPAEDCGACCIRSRAIVPELTVRSPGCPGGPAGPSEALRCVLRQVTVPVSCQVYFSGPLTKGGRQERREGEEIEDSRSDV
eukprot:750391-Hanusia_phi.AAC.9